MTNLEKDIERVTTISKNLLTEVERTGLLAALVMAATPMAQPFNHEKTIVVCSMMALTSLVLMNLAANTNTKRLPNCVTSIVTVLLQINAKLGKPFPANDIMCAALNT